MTTLPVARRPQTTRLPPPPNSSTHTLLQSPVRDRLHTPTRTTPSKTDTVPRGPHRRTQRTPCHHPRRMHTALCIPTPPYPSSPTHMRPSPCTPTPSRMRLYPCTHTHLQCPLPRLSTQPLPPSPPCPYRPPPHLYASCRPLFRRRLCRTMCVV